MQLSLWWWTTFTASDIKEKVDYLPGVEYLFARITPDQLDLPDFVLNYDYEVRRPTSIMYAVLSVKRYPIRVTF